MPRQTPSRPAPPAAASLARWRGVLAALVVGVCWLAFTPDPPPSADTGWDKLNHLLAFAALAFCGWFSWGDAPHRMAGVTVSTLGFGVFIELVQLQIPGRTGEWPDVLADAVGIAAGLAAALAISRRRLTP